LCGNLAGKGRTRRPGAFIISIPPWMNTGP
jgi:hypothetical protein